MVSQFDLERAAARTKSYTGSAVLVFFLYWIFWPAGFILNWVYMQEAKRMEGLAGQSLPGQGCLGLLFGLNVILLILTLVAVVVVFFIAASEGGF